MLKFEYELEKVLKNLFLMQRKEQTVEILITKANKMHYFSSLFW